MTKKIDANSMAAIVNATLICDPAGIGVVDGCSVVLLSMLDISSPAPSIREFPRESGSSVTGGSLVMVSIVGLLVAGFEKGRFGRSGLRIRKPLTGRSFILDLLES